MNRLRIIKVFSVETVMFPRRDLRGSLKVFRHFGQRKRSVPFRLTPKRLASILQVSQVIVFVCPDTVTMI